MKEFFKLSIYLFFGLINNLIGIFLLVFLTNQDISLNLSLFIAILFCLIFYIFQNKIIFKNLKFSYILIMFLSIFFLNRFLLWLIHEEWGLELIFSQFFSIILITVPSFFLLNRRMNENTF